LDGIPVALEVAVALEALVELVIPSEQVEEGEEGDLIGA
jgi:hypothetical protein